MPTIDALAERLIEYLGPDEIRQVRRAYYYAEQAHDGQFRRSGEPYIVHPLAVADILANMYMDHQSLMAAMLHDVIEDTNIPKEIIAIQFDETIANLVDGVSKLTQIHFESKAEQQAGNFQKMALAMANDIRVILVKLADRLHNMRTLGALNPEKKRRIAKETLDIYSPIANRLGMNTVRIELEELCFHALFPMRAKRIAKAVKKVRGNRSEIVDKINEQVRQRLAEENIAGRCIGREKRLLSIYNKMKEQKKSFSDVTDVYGFRIITDSVDTCYRILGVIHNLYKPVPGRFKDYIAIPKTNGYQSLHTTLLGMHGIPIEVQVRTEEMEAMANNGIAAHWLYKAGDQDSHHTLKRAQQWVRGVLEIHKRAGNPLEFIEHVKNDLFPDEIYVFTPKGKIMELPKGATPVDFAFAVHTDVGSRCIACRIDRHLAPLSQPLVSGQTIEIVTSSGARPNPTWLNFVVSGKARGNIRHFLKHQQESEAIDLGRRLLLKGLASNAVNFSEMDDHTIKHALKHFTLPDIDSLYREIGLGNRMANIVANQFSLLIHGIVEEGHAGKTVPVPLTDEEKTKPTPFIIKGTEGMVIAYAKCCNPIPGDPIVGFMSAGKGAVVHAEACKNIAKFLHDPEKCTHMRWDKNIQSEFAVELHVELENQRGVIALLASVITQATGNIESINMQDRDARICIVDLSISVEGRIHLARIMRRIKHIKSVIKVSRKRTTQN